MEKLSGIITSEIKSISYSPILFRFTLTDMQDQHYNMLIHTHALNFFQQAKMGSVIEVWAVKNNRNQYVIRRFNVFDSHVLV
ncbi:hypothetical protein ITQ94_08095 [Pediococcus pentosaceus]|uniref:hypothetical protein n=1 Tax=Pediococcus pentosaceus TaxID=1255 RepID=UPI0018FE5280|nr:hypothetical protein [Pediococcus pentosaceus]MBF7131397.1 hypothetical protein [Pediococcus pentosaceus]